MAERLDESDFEAVAFLLAVEARLGIRFVGALQRIAASLADEEVATRLEVRLGSAILLVQRTYYLAGEEAEYVAHFRYPGANSLYEVPLTRVSEVGSNFWGTPAASSMSEHL